MAEMPSPDEDETSQYKRFAAYAAIGVGSYIAYKYLFSGTPIESAVSYAPPKQSELGTYRRVTEKDKPYWVTKPQEMRPIQLAKKGSGAWKPATVFDVIDRAVAKKPDSVHFKKEYQNEAGEWIWREWTRKEVLDNIKAAARGFIKLGLQPWEGVCIIGFNAPQWVFADIAAIYAGGLAAGIYTTNNAGQCQYIADHCNARIAVVEGQKQLNKFLAIRKDLKNLTSIVVWDGEVPNGVNDDESLAQVLTWEQLIKLGNTDWRDTETEMKRRITAIRPEQCCTLIYTSGTTGAPKGVMLSHDNVTWSSRNILHSEKDFDFGKDEQSIISFLPLSHIAAQIIDIHAPYAIFSWASGDGSVTFARPDALKGSLGKTLAAARPTIFFGVPRVWEKLEEKIKEIGKSITGVKKAVSTWAKNTGLEGSKARRIGGSKVLPAGYWLAEKVVFNNLKAKLGFDRLKLAVSGAAPIKKSTLDYFSSLSIDIMEVYGMSECTGAHSTGRNYHNTVGGVGAAVAGIETLVLNDSSRDKPGEGEICMRGRHVMMGYLYNAEKTKESIDPEGYLHTGDVGKKDDHHIVWITGRIKELIITAGGENVAPIPIEDYIKTECAGIAQFVLIGDNRKYLTALVTLQSEPMITAEQKESESMDASTVDWKLTGSALDVSPDSKTVKEAQNDAKWNEYITNAVTKYNTDADACVSNAQRVQYFRILDRDFLEIANEMTSTLKLKRSVINELYRKTIDSMYQR